MIEANSLNPPEIICFTDKYDAFPLFECDVCPVPDNPISSYRWPLNCLVRANLWNLRFCREHCLGDEVLSLDVDVIVDGDVNRFFGSGAPLYIGGPQGRPAQYWGGAFAMTPGTNPQMWDDLNMSSIEEMHRARDANGRKFLGSDQAWLAFKAPGAKKFGRELSCDWRLVTGEGENPVVIQFGGTNNPWSDRVGELAPELAKLYNQYTG
jgi:hypothetical protein